ncbi:MAG: hypothetical protein V3S37_02185, partial [Dehalococcoidia bacterium]
MAEEGPVTRAQRVLALITRLLVVARYFFVVSGLAFFAWEVSGISWTGGELDREVLEVLELFVFSVAGVSIAWIVTRRGEQMAREAHRKQEAMQREVTERKRTEEELRRRTQEMEVLFNIARILAQSGGFVEKVTQVL